MLSDITLGQYFPGRSILHRMDPRAKMVLVLAAIVLIFTAFNFASMGLVVALILAAMLLSGVPVKMYLKSMKAILFIVASILIHRKYMQGLKLKNTDFYINPQYNTI